MKLRTKVPLAALLLAGVTAAAGAATLVASGPVEAASPGFCESTRLDTANPNASFSIEGNEFFTQGPTALRLEDTASSDFIGFFAIDPHAAAGKTLDLVATFQVLQTVTNDADTGFRIVIGDGLGSDPTGNSGLGSAAVVGAVWAQGYSAIGLLGQGPPSNLASWHTVPVDWTAPVTVRLRRYADGSAEVVSVNGVAPDPAVFLPAAELPEPTRGAPSVEFGSFSVVARVTVDVFELYTEYACGTDVTAPAITCTAPDQSVWYGTDVNVPCTASDGESGLASADDAAFSLTTAVALGGETAGTATGTREVCDNAGNCATAGPYSFDVDRKAPTIACNAGTFLVNQSPAMVTAVATDAGSGPASQTISAAADTSSAGASTVALAASDAVGNVATQSCAYTVGHEFSGFLAPVENPNTVNTGKAGRTYPVKWQLRDANGTFVTSLSAVADLAVKTTSCAAFTNDPTDALETSTTGATGLRYDGGSNQYVYNWSTPSTPGCYTLFLKLDSGQAFPAYFRFS